MSKTIYLNDAMTERGLFINPDGEFESEKQIKRKISEIPAMETPIKFPRDFDYWTSRFRKRQEQWMETSDIEADHATIQFKGDTIINFIGDAHLGAPLTHYKRLEEEVKAITETPNSYVILVGDLVDGYFWGGSSQMEDMEQPPEQFLYMRALINHLAKNRKLLIGFAGDHDKWAGKTGLDPYMLFNGFGAHYMEGLGHLTAKVDDQEYRMTGAHRLQGFSIRDNTWASKRASQEVQGADIYFNAHTHTKGHSIQPVNMFGGEARMVHYISLGPYKSSDEYARKHGFPQQAPEAMYGSAVLLKSDSKEIVYFDDILKANK